MKTYRELWEEVGVYLPRVLGWSVDFPDNYPRVHVFRGGILIYSVLLDEPTPNREAAMRIIDELEARGLAYFEANMRGRAEEAPDRFWFSTSKAQRILACSRWYPIEDLASPYLECLALTLKALAEFE